MPYFDVADDDHKALLPDSIRGGAELENVAADAEADVIAAFTDTCPSASSLDCVQLLDADGDGIGLYVCLKGYTTDPAEAEQNLAAAMRRSIAEVIRWKWPQRNREPSLSAESTDMGKSRTFRSDSEVPIPASALRWLVPYDSRKPVYYL